MSVRSPTKRIDVLLIVDCGTRYVSKDLLNAGNQFVKYRMSTASHRPRPLLRDSWEQIGFPVRTNREA